MPKAMKTCRVCGTQYEACRTSRTADGVFRWQEVACTPECGAIYLKRINLSRGIVSEPVEAAEKKAEETVETKAEKKSAKKRPKKDDTIQADAIE